MKGKNEGRLFGAIRLQLGLLVSLLGERQFDQVEAQRRVLSEIGRTRRPSVINDSTRHDAIGDRDVLLYMGVVHRHKLQFEERDIQLAPVVEADHDFVGYRADEFDVFLRDFHVDGLHPSEVEPARSGIFSPSKQSHKPDGEDRDRENRTQRPRCQRSALDPRLPRWLGSLGAFHLIGNVAHASSGCA